MDSLNKKNIQNLKMNLFGEMLSDITHQWKQPLSVISFATSALNLKTPDMEKFRQLWIETAACHMAVRAGQSLNQPQMQGLLDDLMKSERPYSCPHGRPTLIRFTDNDLAKLFKRI